jgi:AraC-like DNA-binding protein
MIIAELYLYFPVILLSKNIIHTEIASLEIQRPSLSVSFTTSSETIHDNDAFSLILFIEGSAHIQNGDAQYSIMAPGCLCINETERVTFLSAHNLKSAILKFHPAAVNSILDFDTLRGISSTLSQSEMLDRDYLSPFIKRDSSFYGFIQLYPSACERITAIIRQLDRELSEKSDKFWPCRSRSHMLEILFLLFSLFLDTSSTPSRQIDSSLAGRIIHFIHCNFSEKILVPDLCRMFDTNKTTINKEIRNATGLTVVDYINKIRIHNACLLLRDTSLPVQEILYRTGFNDVAHFGRIFRKFTNMTPREYRTANPQRKA